MATLERLSQPGPSSLVDVGGGLAPEAPAPFPSDQIVALRTELEDSTTTAGRGGYARQREVSISSLEPPPSLDGHLPPGYDEGESDPFLDDQHAPIPPTYPHEERPSFEDHDDYARDKTSYSSTNLLSSSTNDESSSEEKMRLDLDSVTAAISRLYTVAPQLGDQRVELNDRKRDEMDLARMVGRGKMTDQVAESKGKQREETKEQELGQIWERIEQAHGRRLNGQEAEMRPSGSASAKKERDQKKQAFIEGVADRTSAGRMHAQDSSPPSFVNGVASSSSSSNTTTTKEQQDLITVGQFIRELGTNAAVPSPSSTANCRTSISSQTPTPPLVSSSSTPPPPTSSSRRSSFVPAFVEAALQRRNSIKNNPSQDSSSLPDVGSSSSSSRQVGYRYLAELQESIRVVQVHLELEEIAVGTELDVEVVEGEGREARIRRSSKKEDGWEIQILLPGSANPHSFKVFTTAVQPSPISSSSSTISFRLSGQPSSCSSEPTSPPLSAPFLASLAPTSLACSTCSNPVVTPNSQTTAYKDLPSEHWEELVGSWLCHDEMKLALGVEEEGKGQGGGGGGGFWPREREVLVGGNYVLVGERLVRGEEEGVWRVRRGGESETWQPIDCSTCSSPLGRRFNHPSVPPTSTFKFQKYAITPVGGSTSLTSSPPSPATFPLSIFIASDLLELADVHRCYHFVVYSEEEPLVPLILIWLLNPSLQITLGSSSTATTRGPFRAAKLMFQTSPSLPATLPPAFDAAEPLHYPSSICTKLADELERSQASYPGSSAGGMMGLKGGWLERW
ncbi:HECT-like ubiquitin-conjugating enzyme-binding-domain-containing protein [Mrakia frigida]|uniref:putative polyadenylation protein n=1 Tax=Mrakia frigida TaxID=29902 RepID=UPI003FCC0BE2